MNPHLDSCYLCSPLQANITALAGRAWNAANPREEGTRAQSSR